MITRKPVQSLVNGAIESHLTSPPSIVLSKTFDVRDHLDNLTPAKGKNRYFCPVCGDNNLSIDPKTGKYQCWSGCNCKDIRDEIAPLPKKSIRPKNDRTWTYTDRDGNFLIRVRRTDDGSGNRKIWQEYQDNGQWFAGASDDTKKESKEVVAPYRYKDCLEAASTGQPVFWVEGESCADALWAIGLAATTTIGGSAGYFSYGNYSKDFEGVDLVVGPDRDQAGIKYAEAIAKDYPDARWIYADPDSQWWARLPREGGLDLADWIADGATKEKILGAIEGKWQTDEPQTSSPLTLIELIEDLQKQNLSPDQLNAQKIELRSSGGASEREFANLWASVAERLEGEAEGQKEVADAIDLLLSAQRSQLSLSAVLPQTLSTPITQLATWQNLKPELYLLSLLTATGSLAKNGTKLLLHSALDFEVTPNIFVAIVAESSQKKSPVLKTMVRKPFRTLMNEAKEVFELDKAKWQADKKFAEENKEAFNSLEPGQRVFMFTKASGESILRQAARVPDQGLVNFSDELAGYFKSRNQFRGGRGSDAEDLLEYYDGSGGTVLRVDGVQADVDTLNYGLLGAIQPKVLQKFLGDCDDANGNWARFFFVQQTTVASTLPDDNINFDISELLTGIYRKINGFTPREYRLDQDAFRIFQRTYNQLEQQRVSEPNPALRAVYGKTAGRIGKIALNLHLIDATVASAEPSQFVGAGTINRAIAISKIAIDQIRAIYCEFGGDELTGNLAKVVILSQRKGAIKARDVQRSFANSNRPETATVRQWFVQLAEMASPKNRAKDGT
jgi:hypothetical protein